MQLKVTMFVLWDADNRNEGLTFEAKLFCAYLELVTMLSVLRTVVTMCNRQN